MKNLNKEQIERILNPPYPDEPQLPPTRDTVRALCVLALSAFAAQETIDALSRKCARLEQTMDSTAKLWHSTQAAMTENTGEPSK